MLRWSSPSAGVQSIVKHLQVQSIVMLVEARAVRCFQLYQQPSMIVQADAPFFHQSPRRASPPAMADKSSIEVPLSVIPSMGFAPGSRISQSCIVAADLVHELPLQPLCVVNDVCCGLAGDACVHIVRHLCGPASETAQSLNMRLGNKATLPHNGQGVRKDGASELLWSCMVSNLVSDFSANQQKARSPRAVAPDREAGCLRVEAAGLGRQLSIAIRASRADHRTAYVAGIQTGIPRELGTAISPTGSRDLFSSRRVSAWKLRGGRLGAFFSAIRAAARQRTGQFLSLEHAMHMLKSIV